MKKILAVVLCISMVSVFAVFSALSQETISKVGDDCPTNYTSAGNACMPLRGAKYTIPKVGSRCPTGFSVDGNYCYRPHKATTKVIPKMGRQCPKDYWIDGDYCQSFK